MANKPTTLITGAGKRIGAEIALHLAEKGHNIVLHYNRSRDEAEALAAKLRRIAAMVTLVQADLEHTAGLKHFWEKLPPVTNIIHNASRYTRDKIDSFTASDLRAHLAINLEAPLLLTQGFLAQLPKGKKGNVIMLGDGAMGWSISPEFFTYAISKHAWASLIDLLAASCAPSVRANMIALAPTLPGADDSKEMFDRLAERAPLKRTGTVEEVLTALDFLLSSPGITGQTLQLGNGMAIETYRASSQ